MSKFQFSGAGWTVNVSWAVVLEPVNTFEVEYTGKCQLQLERDRGSDQSRRGDRVRD
jgi:hypothetical protein